MSFLMAAVVMGGSALWWWHVMLGRSTGWFVGPAAVPGTFVHALVMSLGFMPLFFGGFLFTAGPKWLQMPEVKAAEILKPVLAVGAGWAVLLVGAQVHHGVAAAG
ncbi:MAG TPA: NnrS family protein, partial [Aquabacterium sp.]|nr:NnrS family protein [Aquabacterium sp.]